MKNFPNIIYKFNAGNDGMSIFLFFHGIVLSEMKRPFIGLIPESRMMLHDFTGRVGTVSN